jgi:hypothetical protein
VMLLCGSDIIIQLEIKSEEFIGRTFPFVAVHSRAILMCQVFKCSMALVCGLTFDSDERYSENSY